MLQIIGKRIYLRDHQSSDLECFHRCMTAESTTRFLSWGWQTVEESQSRLEEAIAQNNQPDRSDYFFALVSNVTQEVIGEVGFTIVEHEKNQPGGVADLGYFISQEYWGQGYASEAARLLIEYCFNELGLHKIIATCDAENKASEKVMLHCGLQREGMRRFHTWRNGAWRDRLEYAIFAQGWEAQQHDS